MSRQLTPLFHRLTTPLTFLLTGISRQDAASPAASVPTTTRATSPALASLSASSASGDHDGSLVAGSSRTYIVPIPPTNDPGRPSPLVLVLHGGGRVLLRQQR